MNEQEVGQVLRRYLSRRQEVALAYLFGSRARGDAGADSDYDLAVLTRVDVPARFRYDLAHELGQALGASRVDVVLLRKAPVELAYRVIDEGLVLYECDRATRVEYEATILSRYGDMLPMLRQQRAAIITGIGNEARVRRYRAALGQAERVLAEIGAVSGTSA